MPGGAERAHQHRQQAQSATVRHPPPGPPTGFSPDQRQYDSKYAKWHWLKIWRTLTDCERVLGADRPDMKEAAGEDLADLTGEPQ